MSIFEKIKNGFKSINLTKKQLLILISLIVIGLIIILGIIYWWNHFVTDGFENNLEVGEPLITSISELETNSTNNNNTHNATEIATTLPNTATTLPNTATTLPNTATTLPNTATTLRIATTSPTAAATSTTAMNTNTTGPNNTRMGVSATTSRNTTTTTRDNTQTTTTTQRNTTTTRETPTVPPLNEVLKSMEMGGGDTSINNNHDLLNDILSGNNIFGNNLYMSPMNQNDLYLPATGNGLSMGPIRSGFFPIVKLN